MSQSADIAPRVKELREAGKSWRAIGIALGVSDETARRSVDAEYAEARRQQNNRNRRKQRRREYGGEGKNHVVEPRVDPDEARRAINSIPKDTRPLTARMLGDPLPGRSALDKRKHVHRVPKLDHDHATDVTHLIGIEVQP